MCYNLRIAICSEQTHPSGLSTTQINKQTNKQIRRKKTRCNKFKKFASILLTFHINLISFVTRKYMCALCSTWNVPRNINLFDVNDSKNFAIQAQTHSHTKRGKLWWLLLLELLAVAAALSCVCYEIVGKTNRSHGSSC